MLYLRHASALEAPSLPGLERTMRKSGRVHRGATSVSLIIDNMKLKAACSVVVFGGARTTFLDFEMALLRGR